MKAFFILGAVVLVCYFNRDRFALGGGDFRGGKGGTGSW